MEFKSLDIFNKSFGKFYAILWDHRAKIKSLYAPSIGIIFEDTVKILSTIEDKLEININHIVLDAIFYEDIRQLTDFYYDDMQDGSLTIGIKVGNYDEIEVLKSPIEIIAYIERNKINGLTLCYDEDEDFLWNEFSLLRESVAPYTSAKYNSIDGKFKGFAIS